MRQMTIWKNRLLKFKDNPRAVVPFFKKYLYYNRIADSYISFYKDVTFLDYEQTINLVLSKNLSFVRFGDDVFDMLLGIGLYFNNWHQRYDPVLAERLKQVLSSSDPRLLIGFNPELILMNKSQFIEKGIPEQYQYWTHSKIFLKEYINPNQVYGRALCFQKSYYPEIPYERIVKHLSQRHLIIVASNTARFKNKKFGLTTHYVEGLGSDAWNEYQTILAEVKSVASRYSKEEVLILSSLGPTSKVMVFDLTLEGYTAWDTGQFFDLALKQLVTIY